jgi:hypothetical protein
MRLLALLTAIGALCGLSSLPAMASSHRVGDAKEHITFQFRFTNSSKGQTLPINGANVGIPLTQFRQVTDATGANLNVTEKLHARRRARRPSNGGGRTGERRAPGRRRRNQDIRQAIGQHRHEDDSELRCLCQQLHLRDQHPRLFCAGQGVRRPSASGTWPDTRTAAARTTTLSTSR